MCLIERVNLNYVKEYIFSVNKMLDSHLIAVYQLTLCIIHISAQVKCCVDKEKDNVQLRF